MGVTRHESISLVLIGTFFYGSYEAGLVFPEGIVVKMWGTFVVQGTYDGFHFDEPALLLPVTYLLWD